ncbi:hypothetical protein ACIPPQ_21710, partial [Sphingopyxis sp. LARHCG72]
GSRAVASVANSVALGAGSTTTAASTGPYTINGGTAAGPVSAASTDAVNGSQLYAVGTSVNNLGSSVAIGLGWTSSYDPATGKVATNLSVGGTGYSDVNSALDAVNTLAGTGWNVQANGGAADKIAPGETLTITDGKNTQVVYDAAANKLSVAVIDNPSFTSVTTGGTKLDANGLTISGGPSVTAAGVNAGGKAITNVATGSAPTDAVNLAQLNEAQAAATTRYYSVNDAGTKGGNYNNDGARGNNSLAAGVGASTGEGATNGVAIGTGATITTVAGNPRAPINGISVGTKASVATESGIAIGNEAAVSASVDSRNGIAIGGRSQVTGQNGVAIGGGGNGTDNGAGAGLTNIAGNSATAVGFGSRATGRGDVAIGYASTAQSTSPLAAVIDSNYNTALGYRASAESP